VKRDRKDSEEEGGEPWKQAKIASPELLTHAQVKSTPSAFITDRGKNVFRSAMFSRHVLFSMP